jgi:hypothetical protein
MKILITGNPNFGLASELFKLYPDATFVSRESGYDLTTREGYRKLGEIVKDYDIFINSSALWKFNQTLVLDSVYKKCVELKHDIRIICISSTTDRVKKATSWIYNAEKKALRDYANSLSLTGVWDSGPTVSLISFGSLSNVQEKHPERICLELSRAASYIKWMIDQPADISINEISIDPLQRK